MNPRRPIFVLVALVTTALLLTAGCSNDDKKGNADSAGTTVPTDEGVGGDTDTSAEVMVTVAVADNALGRILVDGDGMTLYAFANDTGGTPTCVDACATAWPPLVSDSVELGADLDVTNFGQAARPDGTLQVVYFGHPLYRFSGDAAPGETTGQGLNGVWFVVGADGQPIKG